MGILYWYALDFKRHEYNFLKFRLIQWILLKRFFSHSLHTLHMLYIQYRFSMYTSYSSQTLNILYIHSVLSTYAKDSLQTPYNLYIHCILSPIMQWWYPWFPCLWFPEFLQCIITTMRMSGYAGMFQDVWGYVTTYLY